MAMTPPIDDTDDIEAEAAPTYVRGTPVLAGLPPENPPPTYDTFDGVNSEGGYTTEPMGLRTIALLKEKYATRVAAVERAIELANARGEKVYRVFETARSYVAQVYTPLAATKPPGEF